VPAYGQAGITLVGDVTDGGPELTGRAFVAATPGSASAGTNGLTAASAPAAAVARDLLPGSIRLLTAKDGNPDDIKPAD
jgi:hypothetical protein